MQLLESLPGWLENSAMQLHLEYSMCGLANFSQHQSGKGHHNYFLKIKVSVLINIIDQGCPNYRPRAIRGPHPFIVCPHKILKMQLCVMCVCIRVDWPVVANARRAGCTKLRKRQILNMGNCTMYL